MSGLRVLVAAFCLSLTGLSTGAFPVQPLQVAAIQEDAYIIGPGDVLELKLFDAAELSGKLVVLNDGTVSLPLVGSAHLTGLTLQQATLKVEQLMSNELLRPDLLLKVLVPRPIRVALVGQVERPGIYSLTSNEIGQTEGGPAVQLSGLPTVVDAIQKAGGITQQANLRGIVLQRRLPGSEANPSYKQAKLDLIDLVLKGNQTQNPFLFDGDIIKISKVNNIPEEVMELASVNLSPQVIRVNVIGEVNKPGYVDLPANTPLVQAVLAAGGTNFRSNKRNVDLVRINRDGTVTLKKFRINLGEAASVEKNPPLRDGDSVMVYPSQFARATDAMGRVSQPIGNLMQIWTLFRLINNN